MKIFIEGISIELTKEQVDFIEKEKRKRTRELTTFSKVLKHFGFTKVKDHENCWEHNDYEWWAEIYHNSGRYYTLFMVGHPLKCGGFPGGWVYDEPKQVEEEILIALEKINNIKIQKS